MVLYSPVRPQFHRLVCCAKFVAPIATSHMWLVLEKEAKNPRRRRQNSPVGLSGCGHTAQRPASCRPPGGSICFHSTATSPTIRQRGNSNIGDEEDMANWRGRPLRENVLRGLKRDNKIAGAQEQPAHHRWAAGPFQGSQRQAFCRLPECFGPMSLANHKHSSSLVIPWLCLVPCMKIARVSLLCGCLARLSCGRIEPSCLSSSNITCRLDDCPGDLLTLGPGRRIDAISRCQTTAFAKQTEFQF